MTTHVPKTAALMAYESGALSPAGRARLERHLRACPLCQRELAAYKVPKTIVFADDLPLTTYGKVDKKRLRQQLADAGPLG